MVEEPGSIQPEAAIRLPRAAVVGSTCQVLQEMSDDTGRSLQGSSNSFFDMLNSAAEAFSDIANLEWWKWWSSELGRRWR